MHKRRHTSRLPGRLGSAPTRARWALIVVAATMTARAQDIPTNVYVMTAPQFNAAMYDPNFVMGPIIQERLSKKGGMQDGQGDAGGVSLGVAKHPQLMRQLGVPLQDLAASVATFIAGSYMAYRGTDFPDENFKPLFNQMRQIIGGHPDFAKASESEKKELHDQMAILGTFMATTQMALKEEPNPQIAANIKQAAKGYLEQFLKTDADRVQITAQGLVLR